VEYGSWGMNSSLLCSEALLPWLHDLERCSSKQSPESTD
jgi:hypothetical protein